MDFARTGGYAPQRRTSIGAVPTPPTPHPALALARQRRDSPEAEAGSNLRFGVLDAEGWELAGLCGKSFLLKRPVS